MTKQIQKSFQECLSKIKTANRQIQFQIRGCKHPKTPSFDISDKEKAAAGFTLSDIDQFVSENFQSMNEEGIAEKNVSKTPSFLLDSPRFVDPPPLENLCGSARFFVNPGSSRSLIPEEGCSSSSPPSPTTVDDAAGGSSMPDDFTALLTYSPAPYQDFRRSMEEMVEARLEQNGNVDWEFMQELLSWYLDLNNKKSYRFILRAFADLIVDLSEDSGNIPASPPPLRGGSGRKHL